MPRGKLNNLSCRTISALLSGRNHSLYPNQSDLAYPFCVTSTDVSSETLHDNSDRLPLLSTIDTQYATLTARMVSCYFISRQLS